MVYNMSNFIRSYTLNMHHFLYVNHTSVKWCKGRKDPDGLVGITCFFKVQWSNTVIYISRDKKKKAKVVQQAIMCELDVVVPYK